MSISTLLLANRGEISIRIARAAAELGIQTVAIYTKDDANKSLKRLPPAPSRTTKKYPFVDTW